jgi:hypothetical protein
MYFRHRHKPVESLCAAKVARDIHETACARVRGPGDRLLRILVYDCRPLAKRVHNPISGRCVDFAESKTFRFRTELHRQLLCLRKVALRYGELADRNRWSIRDRATKRLLNRTLRMEDLHDDDVVYAAKLARQEGLDVVLDPLWGYVAPSLHEHIDGLRTHWPKRTRVTSS